MLGKLVALGIVGAIATGGAWVYADVDMQDRFADLASGTHDRVLVAERGLQALPSDTRIRERVGEIASELGVEVSNVEVSRSAAGTGGASLDAPSQFLQDQLKMVAIRRISPGGMTSTTTPQLRGTRFDIVIRARVESLLWARETELNVHKVMGRQLDL